MEDRRLADSDYRFMSVIWDNEPVGSMRLVELCRGVYRAQRDLMAAELDKNLAGLEERGIRFTRPGGGLFIWVDLPPEKSGYTLFETLVDKKLATVPGSTFDPEARRDKPGIRLNFSMPAEADIVKGCKIFGDTVKEFIR